MVSPKVKLGNLPGKFPFNSLSTGFDLPFRCSSVSLFWAVLSCFITEVPQLGSLTKIDYRKKGHPYSNLSTEGPSLFWPCFRVLSLSIPLSFQDLEAGLANLGLPASSSQQYL